MREEAENPSRLYNSSLQLISSITNYIKGVLIGLMNVPNSITGENNYTAKKLKLKPKRILKNWFKLLYITASIIFLAYWLYVYLFIVFTNLN